METNADMANEYDEMKPEDASVELSVDDLEEAAGGFILDSGNGRYSVMDKPDGKKYYWDRSLERAKDVARAPIFFGCVGEVAPFSADFTSHLTWCFKSRLFDCLN